jgi:hypothetical protein
MTKNCISSMLSKHIKIPGILPREISSCLWHNKVNSAITPGIYSIHCKHERVTLDRLAIPLQPESRSTITISSWPMAKHSINIRQCKLHQYPGQSIQIHGIIMANPCDYPSPIPIKTIYFPALLTSALIMETLCSSGTLAHSHNTTTHKKSDDH